MMPVYYANITSNSTLRAASVKATPCVQRTLTDFLALIMFFQHSSGLFHSCKGEKRVSEPRLLYVQTGERTDGRADWLTAQEGRAYVGPAPLLFDRDGFGHTLCASCQLASTAAI